MNNPAFNELTIVERKEFIGKLIIAAQTSYYPECMEIVKQAERSGLFEEVKPISANVPEIKNDLDKPITNNSNY